MLVEEFEEVIEDWYRNHQEEDLTQFLCANHVLKGKDTSESEGGRGRGWGDPPFYHLLPFRGGG